MVSIYFGARHCQINLQLFPLFGNTFVAQPLNVYSSPGKLRPAAKVRGFRLNLALLEYTAEAHVRARCKTGWISNGPYTKRLVGGA